jgi:hypothetical protein
VNKLTKAIQAWLDTATPEQIDGLDKLMHIRLETALRARVEKAKGVAQEQHEE